MLMLMLTLHTLCYGGSGLQASASSAAAVAAPPAIVLMQRPPGFCSRCVLLCEAPRAVRRLRRVRLRRLVVLRRRRDNLTCASNLVC